MKEKDILLIKEFRANGRQSLTRLSKKTKIPISTIYDKLRNFENDVILKHTALINFRRLGYEIRVRLFLSAKKREELKTYLLFHHRVNSIYRVNNGYDFEIEALFKNMSEFKDFIESLDQFQLKEVKEHFILGDVKREGFMTAEVV